MRIIDYLSAVNILQVHWSKIKQTENEQKL